MSSYSPRTLESTLSLEASEFPLILIEGMPCVGKTTLAKHFFITLPYIDLSDIQARSIAMSQPEAFFSLHGKRLLIDSVEQAPELFKHLPSFEKDTKIVLVGNLPQEIKEDLKNNCNLHVYQLSPFSQREINGLGSEPFGASGALPITITYPQSFFFETIRHGFLPRPHPSQSTRGFYDLWLSRFFKETVQGVMNVAKLDLFLLYMKALAENNMREINHSRLAKDCRISYATAIYWTQFLLDCGVLREVKSLKLAQRRQVKRGKIIYADTGLLCHLLNIGGADELLASSFYEQIFSGFVASEIIKGYEAWGLEPPLYFYRDTAKKHVELILQTKKGYMPIGFMSQRARPIHDQIRHMDVLRRMGEICTDNVYITDGSLMVEKTDSPLISATRL